jgi:hypothetical protein
VRFFHRKPVDRSLRRVDDLRARSRDLDLGWVEEVAKGQAIAAHEGEKAPTKRHRHRA